MPIYIPETDGIYFQKTREYFNEVLSSYSNGNYRSAIVMLYSIAICDILFKLQELKDMFNDPVADEILREVEKMRNANDNKSKSRWEKELIDNVYNKTKLLDLEAYTNLNHLYDHRNFSAHPALNENYELITPSKETTIAHIKNTLTNILIKPPIFIKNIVNALTEDLKEKRELYHGKRDELAIYLNNKYYSKMPESMKLTTIKALWKFCFRLPENADCMENLSINRHALAILLESFLTEAIEYIKHNPQSFSVATNEQCIWNLILLIARCPTIYPVLDSDTKLQIDGMIEKEPKAQIACWFKYSSPQEHLQSLTGMLKNQIDKDAIEYLVIHYSDIGEMSLLISYFIEYYGESRNFDSADQKFNIAIKPYIDKMTADQVIRLIEVTDNNNQIYNRGAARSANNIIVAKASKILPPDFDYSHYMHFRFDAPEVGNDTKNPDPLPF